MSNAAPDFSDFGYRALHRFAPSEVYVVGCLKTKKRYGMKRVRVKSKDEIVPVFKALQEVQEIEGIMRVEGIEDGEDKLGYFKCMLLELCENGTLAQHVGNLTKRGALFSEQNIVRVVQQIYEPLSSLHEKSHAHRNLTPDSVFFSSAVRLVLGSIQPEVQCGHVPLHPYLPPECFSDDTDPKTMDDRRVDMWGLGVIILDICLIPHSYDASLTHQRCIANQRSEHSRIRALFKERGYSSSLSYVAVKLLDKKPEERYTIKDVKRFLDGDAGGGYPDFTQFGFKCHGVIGKGGSAKVFSVEELKTGNRFALKQTHILDDSQATKDLEKEKELLERAAHPSIVNYHSSFYRESGRGERFFCIVMELCSNSLDGVMGEHPKGFPEDTVISYLKQLCEAMRHLHSMKIFHRDITPKNILVTNDDKLKLGDFGISNTFGEMASHPRHTRIGTPNYVSPEVFAGASQSEKIDMWGIGAISLDLTGSLHLSEKQDLHERIKHDETGEHLKVRSELVQRGYSKKFADLCTQLLRCSPTERPSADEVLLILEKEF
eukprot:TRINITY_DN1944_c0_g2_i1.p1 TRINITY_DN1944_c0_g2~~TRINITY_DN1944_c0_g2_i1.p1  ORF type:complete len:567 (+),score=70.83 TRINITY_DN1944_c0_g2_i1:61-1701(+)